jgi:hypothetical protein
MSSGMSAFVRPLVEPVPAAVGSCELRLCAERGVAASFGLAALAARVRPITRIIGSGPPAAREVPSAIRR